MPADVISQNDRQLSSDSVSLRDYSDSKISGVRDMVLAEIKRVDQLFNTQSTAVAEATRIASTALDKRLEGMNEFREQMNDWASRFSTREDVNATIRALSDRVSKLENQIAANMSRQEISAQLDGSDKRLNALESFKSNMQGRVVIIGVVAAVVPIAVEIFLRR
jgi:hypothetical protein